MTTQTTTRFAAQHHTPQSVLPKLRKLDAGFRGRWLVLMIVGAAVSLIGPAIVASILYTMEFRTGGVGIGDEQKPWVRHFWITCLWFLPVLFFLEWITRGKFVDQTFENTQEDDPDFAGRAVGGAMIIDTTLWGPRMVTGGFRKQAGLTHHRRADRTLAAAMLAELLNRDQGASIDDLFALAQGRDEAFTKALAYLMFHELVDVSKNADRVWLLSEAKRKLGVT